MARRADSRRATETLQEIESVFDRVARWVGEHPVEVLAALGAVLVTAAAIGGWQVMEQRAERSASAAVAEIEQSYLEAMGAPPGSLQVPEPANPETAQAVRREHAARFLEVAEEHAGTAAAVSARLEAGDLLEEAGDEAQALEIWQAAVRDAPAGSALRGLALTRYGAALEGRQDMEAAAQAYEQAGAIRAYPARWLALAQAARLWGELGQTGQALDLHVRLREEAPAGSIPAHIQAQLRTLEARQKLDAGVAPGSP